MDYGQITKKRFNTKKAKSIVLDTILKTETSMDNHRQLQKESRHNIYMEFGWTKGSTNFVSEKMTFVITEIISKKHLAVSK
jgi:hypothetical protein